MRRIYKNTRRVEELLRQVRRVRSLDAVVRPGGTADYRVWQIWRRLRSGLCYTCELRGQAWSRWTRCAQVPTETELDALHATLRELGRQEQGQAKVERRRAWGQWLEEAWSRKPRQIFRWCWGETLPQRAPPIFQKTDGSFTSDAAEIDELFRAAWAPIFQKFASEPEPDWDLFATLFGQ